MVCTGARPVAITNCLNYGNPYKPEVYWQFAESIAGMGAACRVLNTPVTGGNVSFYNESEILQVYPTPVIGMLGVIEDLAHITCAGFQNDGDLVYLIGDTFAEIGGSEYLKQVHGLIKGLPPAINLEIEKRLHDAVLGVIKEGMIQSAHDISDGGLAVALAECCIFDQTNPRGLTANIESELRDDLLCFSETQSRIIISIVSQNKKAFEDYLSQLQIPFQFIGEIGGTKYSVNDFFAIEINELSSIYSNTLAALMSS